MKIGSRGRFGWRGVAAVVTVLGWAPVACSDESEPAPAVAANGTTVGPEGGTVKLNQLELRIPAGALKQSTRITIAPGESVPAKPGLELLHVFVLGPDGLVFDKPAIATLSATTAGSDPALYISKDGKAWTRIEDSSYNAEAGKTTASVAHFSLISLQAGPEPVGGGGAPSSQGGQSAVNGGGGALHDAAGMGGLSSSGGEPGSGTAGGDIGVGGEPSSSAGADGFGGASGGAGGETSWAPSGVCPDWAGLPDAQGTWPATLTHDLVWPLGTGQYFSKDVTVEPCTLLSGSVSAWVAFNVASNKQICSNGTCSKFFSCEERACLGSDSFCYSQSGTVQACQLGKPGTECRGDSGFGAIGSPEVACTGQAACFQSNPIMIDSGSEKVCNDGYTYSVDCKDSSSTQCGCTCKKGSQVIGTCTYAKSACNAPVARCDCQP